MTDDVAVTAPSPAGRETREQRAWYFYDWANSAYVTTTATVLMAPYLTSIATAAACPGLPDGERCTDDPRLLGHPRRPGSPVRLHGDGLDDRLGARPHLRRRHRRPQPPARPGCWPGSPGPAPSRRPRCSSSAGTNWQLGRPAPHRRQHRPRVVARHLRLDPGPDRDADERDRVSSKGWALRLPRRRHPARAQLRARPVPRPTSGSTGRCRRGSGCCRPASGGGCSPSSRSSGCATSPAPLGSAGGPQGPGVVGGSFAQLRDTFRELRLLPADHAVPARLPVLQRRHPDRHRQLQPLRRARSSASRSRRCSACSSSCSSSRSSGPRCSAGWPPGSAPGAPSSTASAIWTLVVVIAFFVPAKSLVLFFALGLLIGLVLGGSQALSRSLYSQLIPRGREAEFFSLYQAMERGTSWFGTLDLRPGLPVHPLATAGPSSRSSCSSSSAVCCSPASACARASRPPATRSRRSSEALPNPRETPSAPPEPPALPRRLPPCDSHHKPVSVHRTPRNAGTTQPVARWNRLSEVEHGTSRRAT